MSILPCALSLCAPAWHGELLYAGEHFNFSCLFVRLPAAAVPEIFIGGGYSPEVLATEVHYG